MSQLSVIVLGSLVLFFASFIQGLTSFGNCLVAIPLLLLFMPGKVAVPIMTVTGLISTLYMFYSVRKLIEIRKLMPVFLGALIGLPVGVYLLVRLSDDVLKLAVGIVVIAFGLLLMAGIRRKVQREHYVTPVIGFVSGLLGGSISLSGPPIVLFYVNQDIKKEAFRASLTGYFTLLSIAALPMMFAGKLITEEVIKYTLIFILPMFLGLAAGIFIMPKVKEGHFRNITLYLIIMTGILAVVSALK